MYTGGTVVANLSRTEVKQKDSRTQQEKALALGCSPVCGARAHASSGRVVLASRSLSKTLTSVSFSGVEKRFDVHRRNGGCESQPD
jgi:hypothetical protein